ncbi:hypothetical protein M2401_003680 [Pseudomonas sp. JUb42]|uniref:hypothetical protein n=1 Tax=Pseudomonas sp. JUb42 TaxID=2940611 RepID=UPI002167D102|nr:hypothetical protein [Pseudomonas sp. JUb42]MCS3469940.1 hypothetical protein [Pseudomonas sp. JUb42]
MQTTASLTEFFEVHYVFNGMKYVAVVEKANMSELDSWLCAIMVVKGMSLRENDLFETLELAKLAAVGLGISSVRWNRMSRFDRRRPSVFVYEDTRANGLFLKPKPAQN